jgi:hypothetical protein
MNDSQINNRLYHIDGCGGIICLINDDATEGLKTDGTPLPEGALSCCSCGEIIAIERGLVVYG